MKKENDELLEDEEDKLPMQPPEAEYLSSNYVIEIPITDKHFKKPWELRVYVAKLLEQKLGDEVQLTSMKVKKPHIVKKTVAKLLRREPKARIYTTIKF
jgi:hypothetical protein